MATISGQPATWLAPPPDLDPPLQVPPAKVLPRLSLRRGRVPLCADAPATLPRDPRSSAPVASARQALADALDEGAIIPVFQPQIALRTGALLGFEALARWRLASGELCPPARFLGAAARWGLIARIDEAVLVGALGALAQWRHAGFRVPRVSVNVSAAALRDPGQIDRMRMHLEQRGLVPGDLAVEIVESVLIDDDHDIAIRTVRAMAQAGIAVELDDFGSGHTAVSNLLRLDLRGIKLDRALVRCLGGDGRSETVIRAIAAMAGELGLATIAEGAETLADIDRLDALGCDAVQGYAIARPMTGAETALWLARAERVAPVLDGRLSA